MTGIVLAAGNGTRFKKSLEEDCSKVLKKINGLFLIEFSLKNLVAMNVSEAIIVVGKFGDQIKDIIGNNYQGVKISYVHQAEQLGLINAFVKALESMITNDDVVLQLADEIFLDLKIDEIKKVCADNKYDYYCGITYEENPEKIKMNFSIETNNNLEIQKCIEKPKVVKDTIKGTGFCIFRSESVKILRSIYDSENNFPNDLCDFINYLASHNIIGTYFSVAKKEFNINTSFDLEEAMQIILESGGDLNEPCYVDISSGESISKR